MDQFFLFVTVLPKYFNFAAFLNTRLAIRKATVCVGKLICI
jgi:hypothetical protein